MFFITMEAESKGWDLVKLTKAIYYSLFQGGTFNLVFFPKCSVVFHLQMFFF